MLIAIPFVHSTTSKQCYLELECNGKRIALRHAIFRCSFMRNRPGNGTRVEKKTGTVKKRRKKVKVLFGETGRNVSINCVPAACNFMFDVT